MRFDSRPRSVAIYVFDPKSDARPHIYSRCLPADSRCDGTARDYLSRGDPDTGKPRTLFRRIYPHRFSLRFPRTAPRDGRGPFLTFIAFLTSVPPTLKPIYRGTYDWLLIDHRQSTIIALASALYLGIAFAAWKRARRSLAITRLRED